MPVIGKGEGGTIPRKKQEERRPREQGRFVPSGCKSDKPVPPRPRPKSGR